MISIIVPVYNAAAYLTDTVEMVRRQTYREWELLLVDDASTDGSREVMEALLRKTPDERIRLICKEKNEGAAAARNTGLENARGRYIAFLDADDVWKEDKLKLQLQFMTEEEAGFVFTAYEFGNERAEGTGKVVHVPGALTYRRALSRTVIFTSTVLLDTQIVARELIRMPQVASEDSATWWQILRAGHTARGMDQVLVIYRRPKESLSSNKWKAIRRIWNLYRRVERLSPVESMVYFTGWAVRAVLRRL